MLHSNKAPVEEPNTDSRPGFLHGLERAGSSVFLQSSEQTLLFELLKEGEVATRHLNWMVDSEKVQAYYTMTVSASGFYCFGQSATSPHGEIQKETGYLTQLRQHCFDNDIEYHHLPGRGQSLRDPYLKVAHIGSPIYEELVATMRLDVPWIIDTLIALERKGIKSVMSNKRSSNATKKMEPGGNRGQFLKWDCGFGNRAYNDGMEREYCNATTNTPVMINLTHEDREFQLYRAIGGVADTVTDFCDKYCFPENRQFEDSDRDALFGSVFRRAMWAKTSRFEACTIGVTVIGYVTDEGGTVVEKEGILQRHTDGPNDRKPGWEHTFVFWTIVQHNSVVYRVAFIFYSRRSCGYAKEMECKFLRPLMGEIKKYLERDDVFEYETLTREEGEDVKDVVFNDGTSLACRLFKPAKNPDGYGSALSSTINEISEVFGLSRRRGVELLYLALLSNSSSLFVAVCRRWLPGGVNPIQKDEKGNVMGVHFVRRFFLELKAMGLSPGKGKWPRFQYSHSIFYPGDYSSHGEEEGLRRLEQSTNNLEHLLNRCNQDFTFHDAMEYLAKESTRIRGVTGVSALFFYMYGVQTGLLSSKLALRESTMAVSNTHSAQAAFLKKLGCPEDRLPKITKRVAFMLDVPMFVAENVMCKATRETRGARDVYPLGCWMYRRVISKSADGKGVNEVSLQRKMMEDKEWEPYTPYFACNRS